MSSNEFVGADYDLLLSLLKDQAAIHLGDASKAQAVKDFAQQRSLQLLAVIEHLMCNCGAQSFAVLQSLLQPAAAAPAPAPAPAPALAPAPAQHAGFRIRRRTAAHPNGQCSFRGRRDIVTSAHTIDCCRCTERISEGHKTL